MEDEEDSSIAAERWREFKEGGEPGIALDELWQE